MSSTAKAKNAAKKKSKQNIEHASHLEKVGGWVHTHPLESMLLFFLVVAVVLVLNPLPQFDGVDEIMAFVPTPMRGDAINFIHWLAHEGGAQASGTAFFVIGAAVGVWRLRIYALEKREFWSTACPDCKVENTLKRIHRTRRDRLLNWLTIPTRRYRCRNCKWEGLRLDEYLV